MTILQSNISNAYTLARKKGHKLLKLSKKYGQLNHWDYMLEMVVVSRKEEPRARVNARKHT